MSKEMVISANSHETRVAILEEGQLCEYYVEREKEFALVGSIYKGRVTRVLPGMQSAFVEIGLDGDAFLYVSDFLEGIEEFDSGTTNTEVKVPKAEDRAAPAVYSSPSPEDSAAPALNPMEGEHIGSSSEVASPELSIADAGQAAAFQGAPSAPPASSGFPSQRQGFENRPPRQGRDFGRHGGHGGQGGGRPGGRPGGRGGRSGGRYGRRGGGDRPRPFSRELPQSKFAPSRPYEEQAGESAAPENYVPVILPGESFAKYREKPPVAAPTSLPTEENSAAVATPSAEILQESTGAISTEHLTQSADLARTAEPITDTQPATPQETYAPSSAQIRPTPVKEYREYRQPSPLSSGLEPLPGESLAKWKNREPVSETLSDSPVASAVAPAPASPVEPPFIVPGTIHETDPESGHAAIPSAPLGLHVETAEPEADADEDVAEELHAAHRENEKEAHEDHSGPELSDEEAAALSEHVAEAQSEQLAREAQDRAFADSTAADESELDGTEVEDPEPEEGVQGQGDEHAEETEAEAAEEEAELEEEEETAENEGMIAPPSESESTPADGVLPLAADGAVQHAQPSQARVRDNFRPRMQNPARRGGRDRGRRDDRGRRPQHGPHHSHSSHRTQPRRPMLIADMLKQGQEIIVQIAKEPLGKKGARITSHVALPGRFLVYMPTLDHTGVSRKIASAEERSRLRHLVNDAKGTAGGGFIVRTAAASADPEEVRADVEFLTRTWSEIKARSEQRKAPSLLHRDLNLVERILRDYITTDYTAIWVDSEDEYTKVVDFMSRFQPQLVSRVKLYTKETPVFEEFGIQQEVDKGLRPKVWLKSGGYIVINHTEALVAIDVNTGKFVGKGSNRLEDTIVRTNVEAVKEIVRQMRLRDLGGIIIIDFIDMEERRNREKVMAVLEEALRADRAPSKVLRFNEFGLVAITRKRTKQALERTLCQPCPYCTGSGMVKSIPTLCYEIQTEARKMAPEVVAGSLTLRVHPEISKALKTRESGLVEELERWTKKSIIIQADPTLHWEQYDIY
jgi:ribonuclease G